MFINICCQLRRCLLQNIMHSFYNGVYRLLQSLTHIKIAHHNTYRQTGDHMAAFNFHFDLVLIFADGAHLNFDFLRCALTNQQIVLALHITNDRLIKIIAGHLYRSALHNAAQRNDSDVRGTAANINDHTTAGFANIQSRSHSCRNGFFDHMYTTGTHLITGIGKSLAFHFSDSAGNTNCHHGFDQAFTNGALHKIFQHFFRILIIGDHAALQRTNGMQILRRATHHFISLLSNRLNSCLIFLADRHHRRLPQNNTFAFDIYQHSGCAKVDSNTR